MEGEVVVCHKREAQAQELGVDAEFSVAALLPAQVRIVRDGAALGVVDVFEFS